MPGLAVGVEGADVEVSLRVEGEGCGGGVELVFEGFEGASGAGVGGDAESDASDGGDEECDEGVAGGDHERWPPWLGWWSSSGSPSRGS